MNNTDIINELKTALNIKTDNDLADSLGISHSTVSAWKKRGTINCHLVLSKFPIVNGHFLLTGKGKPILDEYGYRQPKEPPLEYSASQAQSVLEDKVVLLERIISDKDKIIELQSNQLQSCHKK